MDPDHPFRHWKILTAGALFVVGIMCGFSTSPLVGAGILAVVSVLILTASARLSRPGIVILIGLLFLSAGLLRSSLARERALFRMALAGEAVWLEGVILDDPVTRFSPIDELRESPRPIGMRTRLEVVRIRSLRGEWRSIDGRVWFSCYQVTQVLHAGDRIRVLATVSTPGEPSNPGQVDFHAFLRRSGVSHFASVSDPERLSVLPSTPSLRSLGHDVRRGLAARLRETLPDTSAGLAISLLLGDRRYLTPDQRDRFQDGGLMHYFAVSGLHVGLVAGTIWILMTLVGVRHTRRAFGVIAVLWGFALITGFHLPVLRAAIMGSAVVGADLSGRIRNPVSALVVSGILLLLFDPQDVYRVGFQLSFLSVTGILLLLPRLQEWIDRPHDPLGGIVERTWPERISRFTRRYAGGALAVSLAAWLATLPLAAITFHQVSPIGPAANVAAYPLVLASLLLTPVHLAVSWIPGACHLTGWAVELALSGLDSVSGFAAGIPLGRVAVPEATWWGIGLYAVALLGVLAGRARFRGCWILLGMTAFCLSIRHRPVEDFRITVFDVGRGSAAVVEFPTGECWVWDCGSVSFRDPGRSIVAPYLWSQGEDRIDRIVLTHSDLDHISGVPFLVRNFDVGEVVVPPQFGRGGERVLLQWLKRHHVPIVRAGAGDCWTAPDGGCWRVVNPAPGRYLSDNDSSLAAVIRKKGWQALLTGDMEADGWATTVASGLPDRIDLMLVPHHGRPNALPEDLFDQLSVGTAVISATPSFADPDVVAAYRAQGARVLVTGVDGAVTCRIGDEVTVEGFR
jgi:competence protein ComEC